MKNYDYKQVTQSIEQRQFTIPLLLSCLGNLEPRISKAAYFKAKFKNAGEAFNGCYSYELNELIGYRKLITDKVVTNSKYSREFIKDTIKYMDKADILSNKLTDEIITLLVNDDYILA